MKGTNSLTTQKPQLGNVQKAVVKKAIAKAVAVEREHMKQEKEARDAEKLFMSNQEREVESNMAEKKVVKKVVEKKEPVKKVTKTVAKEPVAAVVNEAEKPVTATEPVKEKVAAVKQAEINEEVFVQYGNSEFQTKDIVEKVKAAYVAEGHTAGSIKQVRVYIKPEEGMVYYVVNNEYASGISLF